MTPFNNQAQPLQTVPKVDLEKYVGKWYEIASFPQYFQKGCHCTTAEYTLSDKGNIIVENRCNKDSVHGKESYIKGKAFVEEGSMNAKLKVQFFWPFKAKYWIIDLASVMLASIGILTINKAKTSSLKIMAIIPFVFSMQQFSEG